MNRSQYFNYIEEKIDYLSYRISKRGKINLLDLNIYSETFFAEMINMLLHLNLKNMNAVKQKVEGIDLIDHDNKVVAQVSSTNTRDLNSLLSEEKRLSEKISKGDTFEELEKVIAELNEKYRMKGEYETTIAQISEVEQNIKDLNIKIDEIDNVLFSEPFENKVKEQIKKFNRFFSAVSQELYDESYALTYEKAKNKKTGKMVYKFNSFNANMSSGKKQGEILCFDLAYLLFAETEEIPSLKFLLNDKKELMHDHQLIKVAEYVKNKNMQLVISILKDKLPERALKNAHVVVELSQDEKLFKMEKYGINQ